MLVFLGTDTTLRSVTQIHNLQLPLITYKARPTTETAIATAVVTEKARLTIVTMPSSSTTTTTTRPSGSSSSSSTSTRRSRRSLSYCKYVAVHAALFMSGLVFHHHHNHHHYHQVLQVQSFGLESVPSSPTTKRLSMWSSSSSSSTRGWHLRPLLSTRNHGRQQNDQSSSSTTTALHAAARLTKSSGGRKPGQGDKITTDDSTDVVDDDGAGTVVRQYRPKPAGPSECRLTVIQITDVYTLEHLASLKTLVEDIRAKSPGAKVVCMLTGDFLSPYLLSSVDKGKGMMNALNKIPLDYLTWGNHEGTVSFLLFRSILCFVALLFSSSFCVCVRVFAGVRVFVCNVYSNVKIHFPDRLCSFCFFFLLRLSFRKPKKYII